MASGMPSSREHTSAIAAELPSVSVNNGLAARARVTNRLPASDAATAPAVPSSGRPSGGTGKTYSPGTSRRSLLVVTMRTWWHCSASMTTTRPAGPSTCSQLSSTISSSRSASARTTPAIGFVASRSGTPSPSATEAGTSAGSVREASSTSRAPSPNRPAASVAARSASRVLPHPPGPVNVTTRAVRRPSRTAAICGPRPTSELTSAGNPERRSSSGFVCPPARISSPTTWPRTSYDRHGREIHPSADAGGNGNRESFLTGTSPIRQDPMNRTLASADTAHYYQWPAQLSTQPATPPGPVAAGPPATTAGPAASGPAGPDPGRAACPPGSGPALAGPDPNARSSPMPAPYP